MNDLTKYQIDVIYTDGTNEMIKFFSQERYCYNIITFFNGTFVIKKYNENYSSAGIEYLPIGNIKSLNVNKIED